MSKEATAFESGQVQTTSVRSFLGHTNQLSMAIFSSDGKRFISSSYDQTIRLWDVDSGQELKNFSSHTEWVKGIAISLDGEKIVSCSLDHTAKVWDTKTGQELCSFGDESIIQSVAISPNKKYIVTGSEVGTARLWSLETKKEVLCFGEHMTAVLALCFSLDGGLVAGATGKSIYVWNTQTGEQVAFFESNKARVLQLRLMSNNKHLISSSEDGVVRTYSIEAQKELRQFNGYNSWLQNIALSPDEKYLFAAYDSYNKDEKIQVTIRRWPVENEKEFNDQHLVAHEYTIAIVAFSPDCRRVITGSTDKKMFLWDLK